MTHLCGSGRKLLCAVTALVIFGSGCSHKGSSGDSARSKGSSGDSARSQTFAAFIKHASRGKVSAQVTYQPQTVVFDEPATDRAFKRLGNDGSTFTLDGAEPAVRQLKPGSVLFLYGVALRRVTAVASQGSDVVVTTTQADLTDAIQDGDLQWEVPVDFTFGAAQDVPPPQKTSWLHDLLVQPVWAAEPGQTTGSLSLPNMDGLAFEARFLSWDCAFEFVPAGANRINIKMEVKSEDVGGVAAELKGEGYVQNLSSVGRFLIKGGLLDTMMVSTGDFSGKVDFTWLAAQRKHSGFPKEVKIKIPGASYEYPIIIAGFPFIGELSAAILVHTAFTSKDSFSTGGFTVTYDGKEGLRTSSAGTAPEGEVHGTKDIDHKTSIFGLGAGAVTAALELPRVELALGIMSPLDRVDVTSAPSWVGMLNPGANTTFLKIKQMAKTIEALALPIKPFAFFNIVTSTGTFTSGETGTLPGASMLVPCQRAQIVVSGNIGVGAKIGFDLHALKHGLSSTIDALVPHTATIEPLEASLPLFKTAMQTDYKNGIKCNDDIKK